MSVWKRGGKSNRDASYNVSVTVDSGGRPCRRHVCTHTADLKAAQEIERKIHKLLACHVSGEQPGPDLARWIELMPAKLRQSLVRLGVLDASRAALGKHVRDHAADYIADCEHEGQDEVHVANKRSQLNKLIDALGAVRLTDLDRDRVSDYLADVKRAGRSHRTVNQHCTTAVSFLNWCVQRGRLQYNPLDRMKRLKEDKDRRRRRRAATEAELGRFIATVPARRWPVYLAALSAGLRRGELRKMVVGDADLERARLRVRPEVSKAGREDFIPLHPELVAVLRSWIAPGAKPGDLLFPRVPTRRTFYRDLQRAGIEIVDAKGERLDFHALRKTMATRLLRAGVPASVAKLLTRHRNTRTLEKHYDGLNQTDAAEAVASLPALRRQDLAPAQSAARTSPSDASGCISLREALGKKHVYLLVGDGDQACYTSPLSIGPHPDAPHVIAKIGEYAQVEKRRAISAAG